MKSIHKKLCGKGGFKCGCCHLPETKKQSRTRLNRIIRRQLKQKINIFILSLILSNYSFAGQIIKLDDKFVEAIISVESGGKTNAVGDNGLAIGVAQIHEPCWRDSVEYDKSIGGKYADCFNKDYSIKILTSYLNRYGKEYIKTKDYFNLAKIWNGGLGGLKNSKTIKYAQKVVDKLK